MPHARLLFCLWLLRCWSAESAPLAEREARLYRTDIVTQEGGLDRGVSYEPRHGHAHTADASQQMPSSIDGCPSESRTSAPGWWKSLWPLPYFSPSADSCKRPGYRWDKYLPVRTADAPGQVAAEEFAKQNLQRQHAKRSQPSAVDADSQEMQLLPLQLRPAAHARTSSAADAEAQQEEIMTSLQQVLQAQQQHQQQGNQQQQGEDSGRADGKDGAVTADDDGAHDGLHDQAPWTPFNDSSLTPLIPQPVMWLVAEAEALLRNDSWFNLDVALDLSHLQSVAYCHFPNVAAWNCSRCHGRAGGFEVERIVYDEAWDLFGYAGWLPRLQAMVVSFRGTDSHSIYNWAENMRYWRTDFKVPFPGSDGSKVHTGFYVSYNNSALEPNITAAVRNMAAAHPGAPLYVIGHSMGAALATICAMDVKFKAGLQDVHLYTFGSPRVGNDIFASFVVNQTSESWRFTHNRDIVPSWPPQWVGFHHLPREVWQIDVDQAGVLGVCDNTGEDPRCHNSVCYLGLCTSVSDHLIYLGSHMYNGIPAC